MKLSAVIRHGFPAILLAASVAHAAKLNVVSYDMNNGDGTAAGGEFNYWDASYSGSGSKNTDSAPLTGGKGVLTDGFASPDRWEIVSNAAGTGPYVGWATTFDSNPATVINPSIAFHFASLSVVNSVAVAVDNSRSGGVAAPARLSINGITYTPTVTSFGATSTSEWLTVSGLTLTGTTLTLEPIENPQRWTFISEVTFAGEVVAVPEPEAYAMLLAGLGLLGVAARRREPKPVA